MAALVGTWDKTEPLEITGYFNRMFKEPGGITHLAGYLEKAPNSYIRIGSVQPESL